MLAQPDTAALAPTLGSSEVERRLLGFFRTADSPPATFALSQVSAPLEFDPTSKAVLAAAVDEHFKRELDLAFTLERTRRVAERIEVWGSVTIENENREICVAFFPGRREHAVAVASLPEKSAASLEPAVESALSSLRADEVPEPLAQRRTVISIGVWGLAAAAFLLARLYRKRRARIDAVSN